MTILRRSLALLLALGALLAAGLAPAAARPVKESATNTFEGTVTTGVGQVFPVIWDCNQANWRRGRLDNGTEIFGIAYTYRSEGEAKGNLPGPFQYEEHAWAFFTSPQCPNIDPSTLVGSAIGTQAITLKPRKAKPGIPAEIRLFDTKTADFQLDFHVVTESELRRLKPGALRDLRRAVDGKVNGKEPIAYWSWTFTSNNGQAYTGYLSADSRTLAITITFDVEVNT